MDVHERRRIAVAIVVLLIIVGSSLWNLLPPSFFNEKPKGVIEIATCEDWLTVSACRKEESITISCVFTNNSKFFKDGKWTAWAYDKDGVSLEYNSESYFHLFPGASKHESVYVGQFEKVRLIVLCSVDPHHPLVRDTNWQKVGAIPY